MRLRARITDPGYHQITLVLMRKRAIFYAILLLLAIVLALLAPHARQAGS
jgi:hypothetical protein